MSKSRPSFGGFLEINNNQELRTIETNEEKKWNFEQGLKIASDNVQIHKVTT
jgi:hypothetical protein